MLLETVRKHVPSRTDDDSAILLWMTIPKLWKSWKRFCGRQDTNSSVQSGARALEILSSKLIGAVLLDLLMPGMDGFQVIRHIRNQETLKDLPIFVDDGENAHLGGGDSSGRECQAWLQRMARGNSNS